MANEVTFEQSVSVLTNNQKVALAAVLRSRPVEDAALNESGWTVFATKNAHNHCDINARGIGAIFAGIGKRTIDDDNIMYLKDEFTTNIQENGKHAIAIIDEAIPDALVWSASIPTSADQMEEPVKEPKKRGKKAKVEDVPVEATEETTEETVTEEPAEEQEMEQEETETADAEDEVEMPEIEEEEWEDPEMADMLGF